MPVKDPIVATRLTATALALTTLALIGGLVAFVPRIVAFSATGPLLIVSDVVPWLVILGTWLVAIRAASRESDLLWALPSALFWRALVFGCVTAVIGRSLLGVYSTRALPLSIAAASFAEDILYALGIISLAALAAFALSRTLLRPTLYTLPPPDRPRDISLRTRFVVIATATSFATAGVLLNILVDFQKTPDDVIAGYIVLATALVYFAMLIGWLVGEDTSRGVVAVAGRLRGAARGDGQPVALPAADEIGALVAATIEVERRLSHELARAAASAERERIARELHDGVAKSVSILALEAATAATQAPPPTPPELVRIQRLARLLSEELRAIVTDVRVPSDPRPFDETVRALAERYGAVEVAVSGETDRIGTLARFELGRVIDEAIANARRHAGGTRIGVQVAVDADRVRVDVEDDGVGIEGLRWEDLLRSGRYGLLGMQERVTILSGTFSITTGPKGGTRVHVDVPLQAS